MIHDYTGTRMTGRSRSLLVAAICISAISIPVHAEPVDARQLHMESFETIWATVNEHHFDPEFGGIDWKSLREEYREKIGRIDTEEEFLRIANRLLGELGLSHYAVMRVDADTEETDGTLGLTVGLIDRRFVVTSVTKGFPAANAGIRRGCVIMAIDGKAVEDMALEPESATGDDSRRIRIDSERAINQAFFGATGTDVSLVYLDEYDTSRRVRLHRVERPGRTILNEDLPPFYVEFEEKRLAGNIAYVAFNMFLPPVDKRFAEAVDGMFDARGLIIDIRGNRGGMPAVGEAIAAKLVDERTLFSLFRYRDRIVEAYLQPAGKAFTGPVAVLIDGGNASSSERFAGCIQAVGRATVVGERSSGSVGPASTCKLPNGTVLMYLLAQSLTPTGQVLEGFGVEPDIVVSHERRALLAGRDLPLEKAIDAVTRS